LLPGRGHDIVLLFRCAGGVLPRPPVRFRFDFFEIDGSFSCRLIRAFARRPWLQLVFDGSPNQVAEPKSGCVEAAGLTRFRSMGSGGAGCTVCAGVDDAFYCEFWVLFTRRCGLWATFKKRHTRVAKMQRSTGGALARLVVRLQGCTPERCF
jgi:hypothetical protein